MRACGTGYHGCQFMVQCECGGGGGEQIVTMQPSEDPPPLPDTTADTVDFVVDKPCLSVPSAARAPCSVSNQPRNQHLIARYSTPSPSLPILFPLHHSQSSTYTCIEEGGFASLRQDVKSTTINNKNIAAARRKARTEPALEQLFASPMHDL